METPFKGIVGAPVTPFTADNRVDRETFEKLVNFLIETGVDALGIPMHMGESLNLSIEERQGLVEAAVKVAGGRTPVLAHVSLAGTDQVIELARHAQKVGAAGVVVLTPYYWQPPPEALLAHFVAVGAAIDIPMVVYSNPHKLGVSVTPELIAQLIERLENFVAVKDASFDMESFTEACRVSSALRPGFSMLVGIEHLLPSMVVGGAGAFSGSGAVAPRLVRELYTACANKEYERARGLQYKLSQLWNVIKVNYPTGVREAMAFMGRPTGETRLPVAPLAPEARARLRKELEALRIAEEEPHGWTVRSATPA